MKWMEAYYRKVIGRLITARAKHSNHFILIKLVSSALQGLNTGNDLIQSKLL